MLGNSRTTKYEYEWQFRKLLDSFSMKYFRYKMNWEVCIRWSYSKLDSEFMMIINQDLLMLQYNTISLQFEGNLSHLFTIIQTCPSKYQTLEFIFYCHWVCQIYTKSSRVVPYAAILAKLFYWLFWNFDTFLENFFN